jgi:DNA-binding MarR family transcriptional regulator
MTQTQASPSEMLTGELIAYVRPEHDRRPARLFLEADGRELVLNLWPEDITRGYLKVLGNLDQIQGMRFSAEAAYVETYGSETRYRPVKGSWLKVLGQAEGAPPSGPSPAVAPKAAPRSAPTHDSQRDSIERQVAAKGAIELLATKAITPDEFDQWFERILDRIQGRGPANNEPTARTDEAPSQEPPSSVQRL